MSFGDARRQPITRSSFPQGNGQKDVGEHGERAEEEEPEEDTIHQAANEDPGVRVVANALLLSAAAFPAEDRRGLVVRNAEVAGSMQALARSPRAVLVVQRWENHCRAAVAQLRQLPVDAVRSQRLQRHHRWSRRSREPRAVVRGAQVGLVAVRRVVRCWIERVDEGVHEARAVGAHPEPVGRSLSAAEQPAAAVAGAMSRAVEVAHVEAEGAGQAGVGVLLHMDVGDDHTHDERHGDHDHGETEQHACGEMLEVAF